MEAEKIWDNHWMHHKDTLPTTHFATKSYNRYIDGKRSVLDLGCGDGKDSVYFARKGLDVTAVDFSSQALKNLEDSIAEYNSHNTLPIRDINIIKQDICNLHIDTQFDAIYANLSLNYFDNKTTEKIFDGLYGLLKPEGIILVKCKSIYDAKYGQGKKIEKDFYRENDTGRTIHYFSEEYMRKKLHLFNILRVIRKESPHITFNSTKKNETFIEAVAYK